MTPRLRILRWLVRFGLVVLLTTSVLVIGIGVLLPMTSHQLLVIRSGSMTPSMPIGALLLIGPPPQGDVEVGDIVSFKLPSGSVVTHRVVRLMTVDNQPYVGTQGDANRAPDPAAIPMASIVGKAIFAVPTAGYLIAFIQGALGRIVFVCLLLIFVILDWFWDDLFLPARATSSV